MATRAGRLAAGVRVWSALAEAARTRLARLGTVRCRIPGRSAVRRSRREHEPQVAFHAWLQWHVCASAARRQRRLHVLQDLPIGVAAGGADAWIWQDQLARGVAIGAPPDFFNTAGQEWGSPPLIPWRLRADGYRAFIEAIRATMAHAGGLRIDHVMGLFRLWWVAPGRHRSTGAYVRYPGEDLLDIVALESHRAKAIVVGEDLGTVEPGVRPALAEHDVLSYRLLYFEEAPREPGRACAMAAVTTHDLPTVAGLWTAKDSDEQREYTSTSEDDIQRGRELPAGACGHTGQLAATSDMNDVLAAAYRRLAEAPCTLLSATLEDAMGAERRPNLPGAVDREDWCLPLPSADRRPGHV